MISSEKMDAYLDGQLSREEQETFERQLQSQTALQEQLRLHEQVRQALEAEGRAQLFESLDQLDAVAQKPEKDKPAADGSVRQLPRFLWVAAAVFLLTLGLWWGLSSPNTESLFADYYEAYPNYQSSQSRGEEQTLRFQTAIQAYEANDYKKARYSFEQLPADWQAQPQVQFYLGICYLELQDWAAASTALRKVYEGDKMQEQATWYLALAELRQDKLEAAKTLLQEITQSPAHPYFDKAKALLPAL